VNLRIRWPTQSSLCLTHSHWRTRSLCLRCFLRFLSTEAPSLHRHYPVSSVLRASPSPQTARPGSRELPVDPDCDHRWGFPCCLWSPMSACRRHYPGKSDGTDSLSIAPSTSAFPRLQLGRLLHYQFRGLLSVHSRYDLQTRQVALCDPLHRRLRRLCCLHRRSDYFYEKVIKVKADVAALLIFDLRHISAEKFALGSLRSDDWQLGRLP
jgi:hypothetical protein